MNYTTTGPSRRADLKAACALSASIGAACLAAAAYAGPTPGPATRPSDAPNAAAQFPAPTPAAAREDLDAEQRELERQKREIEQKLSDLAERRRRQGVAPAATPPPATQAAKVGPAASRSAQTNPSPGLEPRPPEAPGPGAPLQPGADVEQFSIHGQATVITQKHDAFPAPYSGPHSVPRREDAKTSVTGTLFLGARAWEGGAFYFDPEIAGGEGFGGVTGIAGFPNGEIPRVGTPEPEPYLARLYFQQVFGFGGGREHVESDQNQLAGYHDVDRLTLTVGNFSAVDFFDANTYSHDPRTQFMNWSMMDTASWDYPADTRGYTYGLVLELSHADWAFRYGALGEPKVANGGAIDSRINALGNVFELEERYKLFDRPGVARAMAYENNARMGNYREALDHPGPAGPDVTLTRTWSVKYGFGLSAEQAITDQLGLFVRAGWNDGHTESWAFTEIDRTCALGLSLKGAAWNRPDDVLGAAVVINGLAKNHREYLAAGGLGFLLGDGRLHYAPEQIGELYYLIKVADHVYVTPDFQLINHPAYNRDRGPIVVGGLRVHADF